MTRRERALRFALSYLCQKHDTVLAEIDSAQQLKRELLTSEAVNRLDEALQWGASALALQESRDRAMCSHAVTQDVIYDKVRKVEFAARLCVTCGHWLSLGPASDDEATAVEVAGARQAAEWADENYTPGYDRFDYCPATESDELCGMCEGLYLAHIIAAHTSGAEEG